GHSDNVQIEGSTINNRVYAEHKGVSDSNEFLVQWQAPEAGSGNLSFYATGIGVNRNGSTSGDGATLPVELNLTENIVSSVADLSTIGIGLQVAPNPVADYLSLTIESQKQETLITKIISATGQIFHEQTIHLAAGKQIIPIDLSQLPTGIYFLQNTSKKVINTQKIIKL
ncbi:MAG: T9SS type A sorting domain-containing protein, partial [Saprospiraceae bacterium]